MARKGKRIGTPSFGGRVVEKAGRDDSTASDSLLHVFEGPSRGKGNRFLCGVPEA